MAAHFLSRFPARCARGGGTSQAPLKYLLLAWVFVFPFVFRHLLANPIRLVSFARSLHALHCTVTASPRHTYIRIRIDSTTGRRTSLLVNRFDFSIRAPQTHSFLVPRSKLNPYGVFLDDDAQEPLEAVFGPIPPRHVHPPQKPGTAISSGPVRERRRREKQRPWAVRSGRLGTSCAG